MTERRFRLHESTRRSLCRLAFAVLGIAPLLICLGLSANTLIPGYSQRQAVSWEHSLSQLSGLTIRIGSAQAMAPYHYQLEDIRLFHPETQRPMGSLKAMTVRRDMDRWAVQATRAEMNMEHFTECCRSIHHWYVCRPMSNRNRTTIALDELTITNVDQSTQLSNLLAEVIPEPDKWGLKASFSTGSDLDSRANPAVNEFILVRHHEPDKSVTELQLRAHSNLPLWLLAAGVWRTTAAQHDALLQPLLAHSSFSGVVDFRFHAHGTSVYLTEAAIRQLDFGQLTLQPQALVSGSGSLLLSRAILESGGLQWAEGSIELGPGRMDHGFFQSLSQHLRWDVPRQNTTETIAFDRLAARFRIQPESFQCIGGLPDGTLIADAHGALARRLDPGAMPVSNLVHALAATPNSSLLVRKALVWLPLDDMQRRQTAQVLRIHR